MIDSSLPVMIDSCLGRSRDNQATGETFNNPEVENYGAIAIRET
jgi:hypothetical protein